MDTEDLRLAVYHHLAGTGRAPVNAALAVVFDRGYVRREPEAAHTYFREVGLEGAFWGL